MPPAGSMDDILFEQLMERKRELEERIRNFFDGDSSPHYGDSTYQYLLNKLSEINEELKT